MTVLYLHNNEKYAKRLNEIEENLKISALQFNNVFPISLSINPNDIVAESLNEIQKAYLNKWLHWYNIYQIVFNGKKQDILTYELILLNVA